MILCVPTTMIYTHVLNRGVRGVRSPADVLGPGPGGPGATENPSHAFSGSFGKEQLVNASRVVPHMTMRVRLQTYCLQVLQGSV
jgi:hypothetical protein